MPGGTNLYENEDVMAWTDNRPDRTGSISVRERRAACVNALVLGSSACAGHNTVCNGDVVVSVQRI